MANILEQFLPVRTFVFETDHVLTNGRIALGADPSGVRSYFARDLYAIHKAIQAGYQISIVRTADSPLLSAEINQTGITAVDNRNHLPIAPGNSTTLYMNSFYPTLPEPRENILYCCPADAIPDVKANATYISPFAGGEGCVYDVIEKVLKLNQHW